MAKLQILDTLGAGWAGSNAESIDGVRNVVARQGGAGEARVWCYGDRLPATQAAFVNGMLAAALDVDSLHDRANVHSDGVIVPTLFALAESRGLSGSKVLSALIAGGELAVRLGIAAGRSPGWFYSSVFGVFGAAAGAAHLIGLDEQRTLHALGIAMSHAAGTQQPLLERSLAKRLQTAFASRAGVEAALLAEAGVTGPAQPFEGVAGVGALYVGLDGVLLDGLGEVFESAEMTFKRFPSCMCNQSPIEAALELARGCDLDADAIEYVAITVSPFMGRLTGAPFVPGDNPQVSAQFSVRYSVASGLLRQRFDIQDITASRILEPRVLALADRVEVRLNGSEARFGPARLEVRTNAGQTHAVAVDNPPGTPSSPLSRPALIAKARDALTSAAVPLSVSRADALLEAIERLDCCPDIAALLD
ncbi:2-methylcitrate dehydratase PrpD [Pseudacidovorax sp. RU35E]|nr:2-methylcitrate dehydratase PrpD [Pseudacidovorax sp. RU35E]